MIFSPSLAAHCFIWLIGIALSIGVSVTNGIDSVHPLGICFGSGDTDAKKLALHVIPLVFGSCLMLFFLPCAAMLLRHTVKTTAVGKSKRTMRQLACRLSTFILGIFFSWLTILNVVLLTFVARIDFINATKERVLCAVLNGGDYEECYNGFTMGPGEFHMVFAGCFSLSFSLSLACARTGFFGGVRVIYRRSWDSFFDGSFI